IRASGACSDPTCWCDSPRRERMKTSQSSDTGLLVLRRVGAGGLAHPSAVLVRGAPVRDALAVARPVPLDDLEELVPGDLAEVVLAALLVPAQVRVRQRESQCLGLGHAHVDELLAQVVVGE